MPICSLSNTKIDEYDPCIMILLTDKGSKIDSVYKLQSAVIFANTYHKSEAKQIMAEYGLLLPCPVLPVQDVVLGVADEFNQLKGSYDSDTGSDGIDFRYKNFFHVWAVEFVLNEPIDELLKDKHLLASELYSKMFSLCKSPFGLDYSPDTDYCDTELLGEMIAFNNETNRHLQDRINILDEAMRVDEQIEREAKIESMKLKQ